MFTAANISDFFSSFRQKDYRLAAWVTFGAFASFASMQYHSLLLQTEVGLSAKEIGNSLLIANLQYLVGPFWVQRMCRLLKFPTRVLSLNLTLLGVSLVLLPYANEMKSATILLSLNVLASNSCFILITSLMLFSASPYGQSNYLFLRSLGTLGFASICLLSWTLTHWISLNILYFFYGGVAFIAGFKALHLKAMIPPETGQIRWTKVFKKLIKRPTLDLWICLMLTNLVSWIGSYFVGSFLYSEYHSPSPFIAKAWSIATLSEIPLIWISMIMLRNMSLKTLIYMGMFITALRMGLTAFSSDPVGVFIAQIFHGFFYGATLSAFGLYLKKNYPDEMINPLNLVSSLGIMGVGTTLGAQLTGHLWESVGLRTVYGAGCAIALLAGTWTLLFFKEDSNNLQGDS